MADSTAQEPSMEEILASIRKIISEDGATVEKAPPPEDVLELTEMVAESAPAEVAEPPASVIEMEDAPPPVPVEPAPAMEVTAEPAKIDLGDRLLSETAAQASLAALNGLNSLKSSSSAHHIASFPLGDTSRTLENIVLELIKPYLKSWLDENLPTLVERIVQKEVQKITRDLG